MLLIGSMALLRLPASSPTETKSSKLVSKFQPVHTLLLMCDLYILVAIQHAPFLVVYTVLWLKLVDAVY